MIYFIPGTMTWNPKLIAQNNLSCVLDASKVTRVETSRGPDGGPGVIVADPSVPSSQVGFYRDRQTWAKRFGGEAWMGFETSSSPGPLQLERKTQLPGVPVKFLDGKPYTIPKLRKFDTDAMTFRCQLAQCIGQDPETGRMIVGEVVPQYSKIWQQAIAIGTNLMDQITGSQSNGTAEIEDDALERFVVDVLAINYRIELPEITALRLMTTDIFRKILRVAIDQDTLEEFLGNARSREATRQPGKSLTLDDSKMLTTESGPTELAQDTSTTTPQPLPN